MTQKEAINKVIDIAKAEIGYLEKKSNANLYDKTKNAGSNNWTKYGNEMNEIYPSVMDRGAAWCDAFVDWCFVKAFGVKTARQILHEFDDYTVMSAHYYQKNGEWFTSPKMGDQIFFKNSSGICHTGIVIYVDAYNVYTVEGNTSSKSGVVANGGAVEAKSYSLSYSKIAGYGRPNYYLAAENCSVKPEDIKEYTSIEHILWELGHRGIVSDIDLWRTYMTNDQDVYWICRKIIHNIRTKTVTEYADTEYIDAESILWELEFRKIVTNMDLWQKKINEDSNIYWLCRKAVHYMRTQRKEI